MMVRLEWDRRHTRGEIRRTRTVARGGWLGGLRAMALYDDQKDTVY